MLLALSDYREQYLSITQAAGSPTAKGGHASEAMRAHYVRVPIEARNTLARIG